MNCNEKLESAKLLVRNAEQIANIKDNPVVKVTILSVLKSIPVFGELIDNAIDISLSDFQQRKRDELLEIILSDSDRITSDMVNDVEFIMNFGKTLEAVNRLATNDKVVYFASLLKNSYFTEDKIKNDEFEEYLGVLSELSFREINLLIEYIKRFKKIDIKEKDEELEIFYNEILDKLNITKEETVCILERLQSKQLCIFSEGFNTGKYWCTTLYYDRIAERIIGEI